jgi:hypothetical protein
MIGVNSLFAERDSADKPFKKTFQLGRSEQKPEAYGSRYVEGLSEARTMLGERRV